MIWLFLVLAWLVLGLTMIIRDVRKLRGSRPDPWRLVYREQEIIQSRSVRDRLAMRIHREGDRG